MGLLCAFIMGQKTKNNKQSWPSYLHLRQFPPNFPIQFYTWVPFCYSDNSIVVYIWITAYIFENLTSGHSHHNLLHDPQFSCVWDSFSYKTSQHSLIILINFLIFLSFMFSRRDDTFSLSSLWIGHIHILWALLSWLLTMFIPSRSLIFYYFFLILSLYVWISSSNVLSIIV